MLVTETTYNVYRKSYNRQSSASSKSNQTYNSQSSSTVACTSSQAELTEYTELPHQTNVSELARIASNSFSARRAIQECKSISDSGKPNPMLPIDQWIQGQNKILELWNKATSTQNFATLLVLEFFSLETLTNENGNVMWGVSKGNENNKENKVCLDVAIIKNIRRLVINFVGGSEDSQKATWKQFVGAMNAKMSALNKAPVDK